jgi:hypothetical protein
VIALAVGAVILFILAISVVYFVYKKNKSLGTDQGKRVKWWEKVKEIIGFNQP